MSSNLIWILFRHMLQPRIAQDRKWKLSMNYWKPSWNIKKQVNIMLEELNAKVGKWVENTVTYFGLGIRNDRGDHITQFRQVMRHGDNENLSPMTRSTTLHLEIFSRLLRKSYQKPDWLYQQKKNWKFWGVRLNYIWKKFVNYNFEGPDAKRYERDEVKDKLINIVMDEGRNIRTHGKTMKTLK